MTQFKAKKGFSMVELMVVVAIIAIMGVAVSVGFRSFLGGVGVRNAASHINDILSELELETTIEEYEKGTVYFEEDYLLVDSQLSSASLTLTQESPTGCEAGEIKLKASDEALLYARGPTGPSLTSPIRLAAGETQCVSPLKHSEREVIYQLEKDYDVSNKIRIFPLNLDEKDSNDIAIADNDYRLVIEAPYAKKTRYQNGSTIAEIEITIESSDTDEEEIFVL